MMLTKRELIYAVLLFMVMMSVSSTGLAMSLVIMLVTACPEFVKDIFYVAWLLIWSYLIAVRYDGFKARLDRKE